MKILFRVSLGCLTWGKFKNGNIFLPLSGLRAERDWLHVKRYVCELI